MSAEPPPKSPQLLPQLDKRPERQCPLPLARQRPQTFLFGQSGTGRLSFRFRKLLRHAKHPAIYDSLRSVIGKAVSRLGAFSGKIVGHCAIPPLRSVMAAF